MSDDQRTPESGRPRTPRHRVIIVDGVNQLTPRPRSEGFQRKIDEFQAKLARRRAERQKRADEGSPPESSPADALPCVPDPSHTTRHRVVIVDGVNQLTPRPRSEGFQRAIDEFQAKLARRRAEQQKQADEGQPPSEASPN